ncbi:MgtC/SapB family protein [Paludisphaera mucosa]|uniref:MgtC/SapB family protein n=1 Tax=Paludisphaera mucosa TaxID=3030827 RepID=A0ABT6FDX9_9BACT|nr:MgtC/SapB family protein [Paludisphaera mucosa]MDG3005593.1 MgtC/SapB family protein [Paludisphaera mucosa]
MTTWDLLIRLTTAAALGGVIGLERHRADQAAGLRTHMLVGLGSALFTIVSAHGFQDVLRPTYVVLDPSRIASLVVSGIGFLGAGTILRRNEAVLGLTTAASIWAVAAVGLAAGCGMILAAVLAGSVILATLTAMKWCEDRVGVRPGMRVLSLLVESRDAASRVVDSAFIQASVPVQAIRIGGDRRPGDHRVEATVAGLSDLALLALAMRLQATEGVLEVSFEGKTL